MAIAHRLSIVLLLFTGTALSQSVLDQPLQEVAPQSLVSMLHKIEKESPVKAFYLEQWLTHFSVDDRFNGRTVRQILDALLEGSEITYTLLYGYALVFTRDPAEAIERQSLIRDAYIQRKNIERKIIGGQNTFNRRRNVTLSGRILDQDEGRPLHDATIAVNAQRAKSIDASGTFELTLAPGEYILTFQHARYDDKVIDLGIYGDGVMDVPLQETPVILEEVVIPEEMMLNKSIGKTSLSISQIKRSPVFLGEMDLIKQVQSQPGVTTIGEIASGFHVRGGSVDQNLVLYDGVPLFNTSHALGFFTAINPEAVGEVVFYRGGIGAKYGGRVSSVLNIASRQGDLKKWTGTGGISNISSQLTVGGPLKEDETSVMVSLRSSYSNWILHSIKSKYEDLTNTSVRFYDASVRLTHKFGEKGKLTFSGYTSDDGFSLAGDTTFSWSNLALALRYDLRVSEKLFSNMSLTYGKYVFGLNESDPSTAFNLQYAITYPSLKIDFQRDGAHEWVFGFHNTAYQFNPGLLEPRSPESNKPLVKMDVETSVESAIYVSDGYHFSDKFFVEAGMRFSLYNKFGPGTVYEYQASAPRETHNIVDSVKYRAGDVSKKYAAAEPRFSLRYNMKENTALKLGYHRMVQYLHLITNTAAIMPTDIWQSSNAYFPPQIADQVSTGVFMNFSDATFETFVEVYYKKVKNTLDFKDGANLILNPHLETALILTQATAYGAELSVSKVKGRLLGTVNYSWSRSLRLANGPFETEQINHGKEYPANHDQPHVVNMNWRYGISRRIFFSGNFVYHTGRPVSLPTAVYTVDGIPVSSFSERNQYRIPDYHRLDLALIVEGSHKRKKFWDGNWIFSFYNVYARKNAYSVFFADDGEGFLTPYRLSVIGTVIPSITYSFKF